MHKNINTNMGTIILMQNNRCSNIVKNNLKIVVIMILCFSFMHAHIAFAEDAKQNQSEIRIIKASELDASEWTFENYVVTEGDVLEISVWQVENLNKKVVVRPDGKISFPLIGDVEARGRSIDELAADVTEKLKLYIKIPKVSIIVTSFGGKKIIILGEISGPGIIRFTAPIRIMEALALAGSYRESAGLKSVLVIRGDVERNADVIVVNALDILKGNLRENIYIEKGDIIFVPRSFVGNVAYFVRQISPLLGAATQQYSIKKTYYQFKNKDYRTDTD